MLAFLVAASALMLVPPSTGPALAGSFSIRVAGNRLVDENGSAVRLLGADRSGAEYACVQGWGMMDGPTDDSSIAAIAAWHINAIRLPLNEDCWLGINGVDPRYSGSNYRSFIAGFVSALHRHGIYVVLDLHWNAPGTSSATGQQNMADADHSLEFWRGVGSAFASDPAVLFDLYNEPHDISWDCWRNGCSPWAGMQSMVDAVRGAGAQQPLMLAGNNWASDFSQWLSSRPTDPDNSLVASVHLYPDSYACGSDCRSAIQNLGTQVPVVTGELGEKDCAHSYVDQYMTWADGVGVSYLGWAWDAWGSCSSYSLISDYSGTPTSYGAGLRDHLVALSAPPPPSPSPSPTSGAPTAHTSSATPPTPSPSPASAGQSPTPYWEPGDSRPPAPRPAPGSIPALAADPPSIERTQVHRLAPRPPVAADTTLSNPAQFQRTPPVVRPALARAIDQAGAGSPAGIPLLFYLFAACLVFGLGGLGWNLRRWLRARS